MIKTGPYLFRNWFTNASSFRYVYPSGRGRELRKAPESVHRKAVGLSLEQSWSPRYPEENTKQKYGAMGPPRGPPLSMSWGVYSPIIIKKGPLLRWWRGRQCHHQGPLWRPVPSFHGVDHERSLRFTMKSRWMWTWFRMWTWFNSSMSSGRKNIRCSMMLSYDVLCHHMRIIICIHLLSYIQMGRGRYGLVWKMWCSQKKWCGNMMRNHRMEWRNTHLPTNLDIRAETSACHRMNRFIQIGNVMSETALGKPSWRLRAVSGTLETPSRFW